MEGGRETKAKLMTQPQASGKVLCYDLELGRGHIASIAPLMYALQTRMGATHVPAPLQQHLQGHLLVQGDTHLPPNAPAFTQGAPRAPSSPK